MSSPNMPTPSPEAKDIVMKHYPEVGSAGLLASGFFVNAKFDRGELTIEVTREGIVDVCKGVKDDGYTFLEDVTAVDWYPSEPRFQISYSILSFSLKRRLRLVVRLA